MTSHDLPQGLYCSPRTQQFQLGTASLHLSEVLCPTESKEQITVLKIWYEIAIERKKETQISNLARPHNSDQSFLRCHKEASKTRISLHSSRNVHVCINFASWKTNCALQGKIRVLKPRQFGCADFFVFTTRVFLSCTDATAEEKDWGSNAFFCTNLSSVRCMPWKCCLRREESLRKNRCCYNCISPVRCTILKELSL